VAPDVFVLTSSKFATTSTIVRRGNAAMLVDPAWTTTELDDIVDWLHERGCRVTAGFCTHAHHDHMLWHPAFGDAPRWASRRSLLADRGVMLAGDMLSDIELPLPFTPDDLPAYLGALDQLASVVARATLLVPGHGRPTDRPMERLDADRHYLDAVIDGRDPDDPRRGLQGMAEAHDKIIRLASQLRTEG
jgi:glyoxylase-like metal-dependent hydrolase (beta-lactamase superfamily II)